MDKNGIAIVLLLLLFVSDAANASLFWRSRKLVDEAPKENSTTTHISPLPSSVPEGKTSDPKSAEDEKSSERSKESQVPNDISSNSDPNGSNKLDPLSPPPQSQSVNEKNNTQETNTTEPVSPPPEKQIDSKENEKGSTKTPSLNPPPPYQPESEKNKQDGGKSDLESPPPVRNSDKRDDDKGDSQAGSSETCKGVSSKCRDEKSLVACTLSAESGSGEWFILVQNEGEESLKVNIALPSSVKKPLKELTITKHQSQRVNILVSGNTNNKIILDAGNGDCVLHVDPVVYQDNIFFHLPSYEKVVTPINGAYFLIFSVVVFGGTWACCLFRKRRQQGGIAYQELEMGASEAHVGHHDVETADGWDEGWDDDWDEENAVKSPGGVHVRNISGNGLTARASNRDGWGNDWDD